MYRHLLFIALKRFHGAFTLIAGNCKEGKSFQFTAIDDVTRARALYIYDQHTQKNAIAFVELIRQKFPFRIHNIQTDNGHEFQALFHWLCEDLAIRHAYIKIASPHLNGKVESSHLTDQTEVTLTTSFIHVLILPPLNTKNVRSYFG